MLGVVALDNVKGRLDRPRILAVTAYRWMEEETIHSELHLDSVK
jgi:hypothetical protein